MIMGMLSKTESVQMYVLAAIIVITATIALWAYLSGAFRELPNIVFSVGKKVFTG